MASSSLPPTFSQIMRLAPLPADRAEHHTAAASRPETAVRRFISLHPSHLPGSDIPDLHLAVGPGLPLPLPPRGSYGGHVFAQAAMAACRVTREVEDIGRPPGLRYSLHTISGAWTYPGYSDRPFIYTVTPLATSATSRSFLTYLVEARQPLAPHPFPSGAAAVSRGPAKLPPLGPTAFSALVSLVPPSPHLSPPPATSLSPGPAPQLPLVHVTSSSPSPQQRFASVLASRAPEEWPLAPGVDVTGVLRRVTIPQQLSRKSFPGVELRKVDMSSWNAGREPWERTELLAYRLIVPPSPTQEARDDGDVDSDAKTEGCETDEADEPNLHAALHVFVSDRNGILMAANHLGFGEGLGRTCSLTCAYVVHVDAEDCVMRRRGRSAAEGATSPRSSAPVTASPWKGQWDNDGEWWISEVSFPRAAVGRATVLSRIWSPGGVHVATAYQDGSVRSFEMEVYSCQRKVPPETGGKLGKL